MQETQFEKQVLVELKEIKQELDTIKDHMVDVDTILTREEHILLDESIKNEREEKLVPLDKVKRK
jgi:hypothetical protein